MLLHRVGNCPAGSGRGGILAPSSHSLPKVNFWEDWLFEMTAKLLILLARPKRFELLTPRFVVWCSIQLSYGRGAS